MKYNLFIHLATCSGKDFSASYNRTCFVTDEYVYKPLNEPGISSWERRGNEKSYLCLVESYGLLEKSNSLSNEVGNMIRENASTISFQDINQKIFNSNKYPSNTSAVSRIDFGPEQIVVQNIGNLPVIFFRNGKIEELYEKQTIAYIKHKQGMPLDSIPTSDEKKLAYFVNSKNNINKLVSLKKNAIYDRDVYILCTPNVLETLSYDEISTIVSSDTSFNKANQILRTTLQQRSVTGTISIAVITIKMNSEWKSEPKFNNRANETLKEIAKSFEESKRGKLVHDILEKKIPETRDSLLKQALYYGLSIDEIDYYLERFGYTRLYPKNPDDYAVMYILKKELSGKYAVRLFNSFTAIIIREMRKNYKYHERVGTEAVALLIDKEVKHTGNLNTEIMCEVVDDFMFKQQHSSELKYAFSDRYQFLNYYLNLVINAFGNVEVRHNVKDEDFSDDKANFTGFFKANGINNSYAINRLLNKKSQIFSATCQIKNPVPEREFFLFIGLLCRLSEEEFDFLLDTAGMPVLNDCEYDNFITVPLKKIAKYFPQFFNTYDGIIDRNNKTTICSEDEWNYRIKESGLRFAVSIHDYKPVFLYRNFAEFILAYWTKQSNEAYRNLGNTKLFREYLILLDIYFNN